jgi:hypothetical protein
MSDEYYALDLDIDLLWHLARPESVNALREERVSSEVIEDEYIARVYQWVMWHVREYGDPPTAAVIEHEFDDVNLDEPETVIEDLIVRLRERFAKNQGRKSLMRLKEQYKEEPGRLAEKMQAEARHILEVVTKRSAEYRVSDIDRSMDRYEARKSRGRGPSFGYEELDEHFWGQEGLTFTIGAPKTMKTWQGTKAILANVLAGKNVWHFPLELPADHQDMRLRCLAANVPYWKYLRGAFDFQDKKALREASDLLIGMGSFTISKPPHGQRDFDTMFGRAADNGADLIIVDQLQYVEVDRGQRGNVSLGEGDTTWYWSALNRATELAEQIPIQVIHQFNRTAQFAEQMPEMQQAKGSAAIEETASLALGLWANKDMRQSRIFEYGTLASRNYGIPSWQVTYELSRGCDFELMGETEEENGDGD